MQTLFKNFFLLLISTLLLGIQSCNDNETDDLIQDTLPEITLDDVEDGNMNVAFNGIDSYTINSKSLAIQTTVYMNGLKYQKSSFRNSYTSKEIGYYYVYLEFFIPYGENDPTPEFPKNGTYDFTSEDAGLDHTYATIIVEEQLANANITTYKSTTKTTGLVTVTESSDNSGEGFGIHAVFNAQNISHPDREGSFSIVGAMKGKF